MVVHFYGRALEFLDALQALGEVRVVVHDVVEENVMHAILRLGVGEDGLDILEVGVDITENGKTHRE